MKKIFSALIVMFAMVGQVFASEPYSQERFDKLQASGELVLVDVNAPWCPTCKKQKQIINQWIEQNPDKNLHVLDVDFDTRKDLVAQFRAPRQSTLLLYKGNKQVWFSVAETRGPVIGAAIEQGFSAR
ncbi:thioredoxin family protein [Pseudomonas gessardii]|uniref:Thioredoxin n=1 Tax=Pseudomonas gessardii TaxID=78544 RepID=A0ABS9F9W4_9PSED|nr:thioredoxin family protein [Pseudomonas gessardii]MBH3423972.1 thioredoxin family protein [Pseudomonas gessardii]MCF4978694.1 thioredoxin [Pseudomonas gessardii]MCF5086352.1 thioredoxin [Pseudomonas gessardii]MCF5097521.1 thioredoxin [Pseudomonas gessardii]MCF5109137.1 thioredoxin [Pseudomonas gessardii]